MTQREHRLTLRARLLDIAVRALLPFLGIGVLTSGLVGLLTFGVLPLVELLSGRAWMSVEATVESVSVSQPRVAIPLDLDIIELRYHYEYAGTLFTSMQFGPHGGLENRTKSRAFLDTAEPGAAITVWVDLDNPQHAMVNRDLNWGLIALSLPALLLCAIGFLMVLAGMLVWNDRRSMFRRFRSG